MLTMRSGGVEDGVIRHTTTEKKSAFPRMLRVLFHSDYHKLPPTMAARLRGREDCILLPRLCEVSIWCST